jgi:hypothetical protein
MVHIDVALRVLLSPEKRRDFDRRQQDVAGKIAGSGQGGEPLNSSHRAPGVGIPLRVPTT